MEPADKYAQEMALINEMTNAARSCQVNAKTESLKKVCESIIGGLSIEGEIKKELGIKDE